MVRYCRNSRQLFEIFIHPDADAVTPRLGVTASASGPSSDTRSLTHVGAYHRPPAGHFQTCPAWVPKARMRQMRKPHPPDGHRRFLVSSLVRCCWWWMVRKTCNVDHSHLVKPPVLPPQPAGWYHVPDHIGSILKLMILIQYSILALPAKLFEMHRKSDIIRCLSKILETHTTVLSREKIQ